MNVNLFLSMKIKCVICDVTHQYFGDNYTDLTIYLHLLNIGRIFALIFLKSSI